MELSTAFDCNLTWSHSWEIISLLVLNRLSVLDLWSLLIYIFFFISSAFFMSYGLICTEKPLVLASSIWILYLAYASVIFLDSYSYLMYNFSRISSFFYSSFFSAMMLPFILLAYWVLLVYFSLSILLSLFPSLFTPNFNLVMALLVSPIAVLASVMRWSKVKWYSSSLSYPSFPFSLCNSLMVVCRAVSLLFFCSSRTLRTSSGTTTFSSFLLLSCMMLRLIRSFN